MRALLLGWFLLAVGAPLAAAGDAEVWRSLLVEDPAVFAKNFESLVQREDFYRLRSRLESISSAQMPSPSFEACLAELERNGKGEAVARNLAQAYQKAPWDRAVVIGDLMGCLGGLKGVAAAELASLQKEHPTHDGLGILWDLDPYNEQFHALLADVEAKGDDSAKYQAAYLGMLMWTRGQRSEALERSLRRIMLQSGSKAGEGLGYMAPKMARNALGALVKTDEDLKADLNSSDLSKKREALMELAVRFDGSPKQLGLLLKALKMAREAWKGQAAQPPFTESEWGELLAKHGQAALLAVRAAEGPQALLAPERLQDLLRYTRWCGEGMAELRPKMGAAVAKVLPEWWEGVPALSLKVALGHERDDVRQAARKALQNAGPERGLVLRMLAWGLESACVSLEEDRFWRELLTSSGPVLPGSPSP